MPFINVMTNSEIKDKDALKAELGNDITAIHPFHPLFHK